jgi:hypothetical protein
MTPQELALIKKHLQRFKVGQEFGVKELLDIDWGNVGSKQEFGRRFKEAVNNGTIPDIKWVRLENSPRHDRYQRVR